MLLDGYKSAYYSSPKVTIGGSLVMNADRENNRRRTYEVRVKLQPEMAARLEELARCRGVPPATLAALVLGEYVDRCEKNQKHQAMAILEASRMLMRELGPQVGESLDGVFENGKDLGSQEFFTRAASILLNPEKQAKQGEPGD